MLSHLSLFSGIGGLDLAAEMAGFTTVGQVEIDDYCNRVLEKHWPGVPRWRDIKDVTGREVLERCGPVAVLSGGVPCQPFSAAGKRRGEQDDRYLWPETLRVICEVRPRWVLVENVRGLLLIKFDSGGTIFGRILADLAENGYSVGWLCYGAGDVGAPHRRERVFIVAHSRCELSQGTEFKKTDEVEIRREMAYQYKRPGEARGYVMAYSSGAGLEVRQCFTGNFGQKQQTAERGSQDVADPPCELLNRSGDARPAGRGEFADGDNVADPDFMHGQQFGPSGRVGRGGQPNAGDGGGQGPTQPRLGDLTNGLPAGMVRWPAGWWPTPRATDGAHGGPNQRGSKGDLALPSAVQWPAGPGPQYDYEPPRIATGVKGRVQKLKALGNAVVPAQAYPIFKAIAEIEGVVFE